MNVLEALLTNQVVSCGLIKTLVLNIYLSRAILEAVFWIRLLRKAPKPPASTFVVRREKELYKEGKKLNVWNLQTTYSL